jgi:hypothetical protein
MRQRIEQRRQTHSASQGDLVGEDEFRVFEAGDTNELDCKTLAEHYFASTGSARAGLAGKDNAIVARDVAYRIVETRDLYPMDLGRGKDEVPDGGAAETLVRELSGPYKGEFIVKPSDGKECEEYRLVFAIKGDRHIISKVTKDTRYSESEEAARDALVCNRNVIEAWVRAALSGKRASVVARLPKGDYSFLEAAEFSGWIEGGPSLATTQPATAGTESATQWHAVIQLVQLFGAPRLYAVEQFKVEIALRGQTPTITSCSRDEEYAKNMMDRLKVAHFVEEYVGNPDKRSKWRSKDAWDFIPRQVAPEIQGHQGLALRVQGPLKLTNTDVFSDGPGRDRDFLVESRLKWDGGEELFQFRLVKRDGKDEYLMLHVPKQRRNIRRPD